MAVAGGLQMLAQGCIRVAKDWWLFPRMHTTLASLAKQGRPTWTITGDDPKVPTETLEDLLRHVRNAVAHGRIRYTSDSPRMDEKGIRVEDQRPHELEPYWSAEIQAPDLKGFCDRFLDYIEQTIG
jgi:hypothetical protein